MQQTLFRIGIFISFICIPVFVQAGPIVRSGEAVSVSADQVLGGDFYALSSSVTMSGKAEHDVVIAGGSVTINAPVTEDLTMFAGTAQVHGDVGDDLRAIGGEVTLGKNVAGDVVVLGGELVVLSTATIEGDILFFGGTLVVEGSVTGSVHGTAESIRINAPVGGDVTVVTASPLTFGDKARVTGNVQYTSSQDFVRAQGAELEGTIQKISVGVESSNGPVNRYLVPTMVLLFGALALFFAFRLRVMSYVNFVTQKPGVYGLIGIGIFLLTPFVAMLLAVSVVGVLVGVSMFALYGALLAISLIMAGIVFSYYLANLVFRMRELTLMNLMLGILSFTLLGFIPVLGGFIIFGFFCVALGGLGMLLYRGIRGS